MVEVLNVTVTVCVWCGTLCFLAEAFKEWNSATLPSLLLIQFLLNEVLLWNLSVSDGVTLWRQDYSVAEPWSLHVVCAENWSNKKGIIYFVFINMMIYFLTSNKHDCFINKMQRLPLMIQKCETLHLAHSRYLYILQNSLTKRFIMSGFNPLLNIWMTFCSFLWQKDDGTHKLYIAIAHLISVVRYLTL